MPTPYVVSEEKSSSLLTLIIDKKGVFGMSIAEKIHEGITTVLVTGAKEESHGNTLVVSYTKTIPEIPEGDYANMFFVWDGSPESLHVLEPLLQKAAIDKARFVFVTDYHFHNEKLMRFIHQEYAHANILFVGDVFGNSQYASIVAMFLKEASEKRSVQLENVGLKHVYPVEYMDVVTEIVKLGFATEKGKIFLACQRHGMTELSLVHLLQKVDPLIKIDFKKEDHAAFSMPEGEYVFDTQIDIARKIQTTYAEMIAKKHGKLPTATEAFFSPVGFLKKHKTQKKRKRKGFLLAILIVLLFFSPVFLTLSYAALGGALLYASTNSLKTGQYAQVQQFAKSAQGLFTTAAASNDIAKKEVSAIFLGQIADSLQEKIDEGKLASSLLLDGGDVIHSFSSVAKGTSLAPSSDFLLGIQGIKNILVTLSESRVESLAGMSVAHLSSELQPLGSVLDIAPVLFGFPEKKTYLVIFQNNTELRPGGGFIGSYALVTVEKGRITAFHIHDVYEADGQLKGHVEPPYVIRRYIPQVHWYMRDSNFDVDFSQDAANAAFFLKEETGEQVDGVIGIDLPFVKNLLAITGPVFVPEYNESVSTDNFFLLTETHAEKNSFAGSTQKKDFLSALFAALQKKISTNALSSPQAFLTLLGSAEEKDVLFGFSDPLIQDVFTVNGFSSALWDGRSGDKGVINDITGINEANIGVDKANYFVTRSVSQSLAINPSGSVSGQLTLAYTNNSKNNEWPGGDYKNYVRFILPSKAKLVSVTIGGVAQTIVPAVTDFHVYEAKGFTLPKGLEVDSATENGKQLFGFITTIPASETQKIVVGYTLPSVDMSLPTLTYNGWLFKQPGVDAYTYDFTLSLPNAFTLVEKPSWIQVSGNSAGFNKLFDEDVQFSLGFAQK